MDEITSALKKELERLKKTVESLQGSAENGKRLLNELETEETEYCEFND